MNKIIFVAVVVVVVSGIIGFFVLKESSNTPKEDTIASLGTVPDLSFFDYSGNTVTLADFKGKPLVVNSWAAWCPFCLKELPDFAAAQKEFGDQVTIIAIDRAESLKTAKGYTDDLGVTDDLVFLLDPKDSFYRSIGGFTMPETIFVDSEGIIQDRKRGVMELDEIRERINRLLTIEEQ